MSATTKPDPDFICPFKVGTDNDSLTVKFGYAPGACVMEVAVTMPPTKKPIRRKAQVPLTPDALRTIARQLVAVADLADGKKPA